MKKSAHKKHLHRHPIGPIKFGLLITSNTRTPKTDKTGRLIIKLLRQKRHQCAKQKIIRNNSGLIRREVKRLLKVPSIRLVITSGGTGCGRKDVSVEAVRPLLAKNLEGFGELFRQFSLPEIGSAAMMSRALLGISKNGKIICSIPGSPNATRVALSKLLIPELDHLLWEANR